MLEATIDKGLHRILTRWAALDASAREAMLSIDSERLVPALRRAVRHDDPDARFGVIRAMVEHGDPRLCEDLISFIGDRDQHVARGAERALVAMARSAPDRKDVAWANASVAVVSAAGRFGETHMSRGVLLAAMLLTTPRLTGPASALQSPMAHWLAGESHPGHAALRTVLRRNPDPRLRSRALAWLRWEPMVVSALARVMRGVSAEDHEALLINSHLALHPLRSQRLATAAISTRLSETWPEDCALPDRATAARLSCEARRGLPRFAAMVAADSHTLAASLDTALADPDATVRWCAATTLPLHAIEDYCFDADPIIARAALLRRSCVGDAQVRSALRPADARLTRRLVRHPDPGIRALARQERDRTDMWNADSAGGRLAAQRSLAADRAAVIEDIRQALRDANRALAAIALAKAIGVAADLEADLRTLAEASWVEGDATTPRIAAAAVSALGYVATAAAVTTLLACLNHTDDRVRANAVESLARHRRDAERHGRDTPSLASVLLELRTDPSHRVRANAIRAMLRSVAPAPASTARALSNMLADDRAMHRVAGLWVVDRAIVAGVDRSMGDASIHIALSLDKLARTDVEPKVRLRAAQCAGRMLGATREAWSRRAANVIIEPKGMTHAAA